MSDSPYQTGHEIHMAMLSQAEQAPAEDREPLPEENRGSWYQPCAQPRHENLIRHLMEQNNLERFYDLGAGDLRLSVALADKYEVIAYENLEHLANLAYKMHDEPDIELRTTDYYLHWNAMKHRNALFAAIGRTNELPGTPDTGIGLEGDAELTIYYPN